MNLQETYSFLVEGFNKKTQGITTDDLKNEAKGKMLFWRREFFKIDEYDENSLMNFLHRLLIEFGTKYLEDECYLGFRYNLSKPYPTLNYLQSDGCDNAEFLLAIETEQNNFDDCELDEKDLDRFVVRLHFKPFYTYGWSITNGQIKEYTDQDFLVNAMSGTKDIIFVIKTILNDLQTIYF